jgi:glycogen phosphorylase
MTDPVVMQLPEALSELQKLALNVRWSWHAPSREVFARIDAAHWRSTGHNPIRLLAEVGRARLDALAADPSYVAAVHAAAADLRTYMDSDDTWYARRHGRAAGEKLVAYFSAEFGITECLRIFPAVWACWRATT